MKNDTLMNWTTQNTFLGIYNLSRLNHDVIGNLNRSITSKEAESAIKKLPINKSPGPDGFTGEFYHTFKEDLMSILCHIFRKIEEEECFSNSFYEGNITLTTDSS